MTKMEKSNEQKYIENMGLESLRSDLGSRVYLLLLFYRMSKKQLSLILHGNTDQKKFVHRYVSFMNNYKFVKPIKKPSFRKPETCYEASLSYLFVYWDIFLEQKKKQAIEFIKKHNSKKFKKDLLNALDDVKIDTKYFTITSFDKNAIKAIEDMKPLQEEDLKILCGFFIENIELIKDNFRSNVLPLIRDSNIKFDSIQILTDFFALALDRMMFQKHFLNSIDMAMPVLPRIKGGDKIIPMLAFRKLQFIASETPLDKSIDKLSSANAESLNRIGELVSLFRFTEVEMPNIAEKLYGIRISSGILGWNK
ncbi:MAG: hypothetical protein NT129_06590 [Candidatus Aenigmarchaeota archaeon]|nr:hypothetical protein [Candidatus Aenigmarchaeota archaeon]